jgi:hypothetical protein
MCTEIDSDNKLKILQSQVVVPIHSLLLKTWTWSFLRRLWHFIATKRVWRRSGKQGKYQGHCLEPQCSRMDLFPSFSRRLSLWSPSCWVLVWHYRHAKSSVQALSFGLDFFTRRFTWTCIKVRHEHYYNRELGGRAGQTDWRSDAHLKVPSLIL